MKFKRLFFDIETSPNVVMSWRVGYKIQLSYDNIVEERAIICICYKWEDDEKVHYLTWKDGCDKKMLEKFVKVAKQASEIVGHNSDRFDIKWVRTRCLFHRIPLFPSWKPVDTLKMSRGGFLFNSNRLDYIGQFLGVGQKMETGGFGLWKEVLKGNKEALKTMVVYCQEDVRLLERVFTEMEDYTKHHTHVAVMEGGFKFQCPRCSSTEVQCNKTLTTAAGTIRRELKCTDCKRNYTVSNKTYEDLIKYRRTK
jgi:DNA polymerase elongation subunit (family B)